VKILSLKTEHYRNLLSDLFVPGEGVNVLYGENAQGKTNLLEALWLFTGGKSFRGVKDSELISYGEQEASLILHFYSEEREQTAEIKILKKKRQAFLNGILLRSPGLLVGKIGAVIFSPEHLSLVREGPNLRRNFLDAAICQIRPGYVRILNRYSRTLDQRNALLKDSFRHPELLDTISIWDERLSTDGEIIIKERESYVESMKNPLSEIYEGLSSGKESLTVQYKRSAENLLETLLKNRKQDLQVGYTTCGPHRDDLEIFLDGKNVRMFASQGQKRSVVLSLKLAEAALLKQYSGEKPMILLDDVLSELDHTRQEYLLNHLSDCQVIITCCDPGQAKNLKNGFLFQVENGTLERKKAECTSI